MRVKQKKLIVLASGTGTLFVSIVKACQAKVLPAQVITLISDNAKALAIKKARQCKIPVKIFSQKNYHSYKAWDKALSIYLLKKKPDFILLAGFLKKLGEQVLLSFPQRVLNIHPSLLPQYAGKGMYGLHVHQAILANKEKTTGITVHFVTRQYDSGPIIAQKKIVVLKKDTALSLQTRVKKIEQLFYIKVLKKLLKYKFLFSK